MRHICCFMLFSLAAALSAGDGIVDVRQFGAVGDGKTDDTAALQKAVDSAPGALKFVRGDYRITQPLVINLDKTGYLALSGDGNARITMAGAGPAIKFVGTHGGTADPKTVKPEVWERQRTPTIDGLEIVGAHDEACGVNAVGTMQLTLTRLTVRECLHGIHLTERNRNILIASCHLYHNRGVGIFLDKINLHQINISNCHVSYCAQGGIVSRGGEVRNLHIGTCDIESNMTPQTPDACNVLLDSTGGSICEVALVGCTIQHNSVSPGGTNIRVIGRTNKDEIAGQITISNNVLSDITNNIHLKDCRGVVVTGNTIWEGVAYNLLVENSSNIVIGNNNFDRNPLWRRKAEPSHAIIFRDSQDCTLNGLNINHVKATAGVLIENCKRFNITNCSIVDCDSGGLVLKNVSDSRISDCLIRNDREDCGAAWMSLQVSGGSGNMIVDNLLGGRFEIPSDSGLSKNNYNGRDEKGR